MNNINISIKVIEEKKIDDNFNNYLVLEFNGDINNIIMNTLRRVIIELIPVYAFDKEDIKISKNTSIYNNDYMKLRLSQFPIYNIDNNINNINKVSSLEEATNLSSYEYKLENIEKIQTIENLKNIEKSNNFTMTINVKNTTNTIMNITTDSTTTSYYYNGINVSSPYKKPLLIIKLKPNEEFNCTAISSLNIGLKNIIYSPVSVCVFSEINLKKFLLNIESLKQISERELIIRACDIIKIKINNLIDIIIKKINTYNSDKIGNQQVSLTTQDSSSTFQNSSVSIEEHYIKGIIIIENESHTFGNLITRYLQDHPNILFAGYKIDHLLVKELTIAYKTDDTNIINIFREIELYNNNLFDNIKKNIYKI